jgi:hypothetical protein
MQQKLFIRFDVQVVFVCWATAKSFTWKVERKNKYITNIQQPEG